MGQSVVVKNRTTALWAANSACVWSAPWVSRSWKDRGAAKAVAAPRHRNAASLISIYDELSRSVRRGILNAAHVRQLKVEAVALNAESRRGGGKRGDFEGV